MQQLKFFVSFYRFAAALALKTPQIHWWVLNVVPIDAPDRLQVIFDRSLIGVYHDWYVCHLHLLTLPPSLFMKSFKQFFQKLHSDLDTALQLGLRTM
jgi:hypothetical protein